MIKPKELRIGNLVRCARFSIYTLRIKELRTQFSEINRLTSTLYSGYDELVAIPLTHEILEKAGFSYHHTNPTVSECFIHDNPNMLGAIVFEDDKYVYEGYEHEIKSVHQLQNLFHALTGE